jgi:hypothetical protein
MPLANDERIDFELGATGSREFCFVLYAFWNVHHSFLSTHTLDIFYRSTSTVAKIHYEL